ncbi:helix-turn-helix domain-containing protein [Persicitalea jodogahamensis]|uniref:HTH araC/xylS-type domain-containing protein n=1 Tax=Persicitalea jodogahamensis TaxID=402147 RepID=A0A8J3D6X1_9BACT|nr:AraC family transcriptional regulator [Persicitalea jodogahamensis]GHB60561.1 hypothetical protein GCM10007390_12860 [Persicitalea jodogahamensis]
MYGLVDQNEFLLLNVARVQLNERWNYQNVISPFYRLYYIHAGTGTVAFGNVSLDLQPGGLYMVPSFTLSHYRCDGFLHQSYLHFEETMPKGISIKYVFHLKNQVAATRMDTALFDRLLEINPDRQLLNPNPKVIPSAEKQRAASMQKYPDQAVQMETNGIVKQLLSRFLGSEILPGQAGGAPYSRIAGTLQHIHENLGGELSVRILAEIAHLNADYFSRIFQEMVGLRPIPYIHQLRVQNAQNMLLVSDASQDEIADAVGFGNRTYFAKVFKQHTGQTAGEYRSRARKGMI